MKSEIQKKKETMLMAFRCGFIDGPKLTKKGRGFFNAKTWRLIHKIKSKFSKDHRDRMYDYLSFMMKQTRQIEGTEILQKVLQNHLT